MCHVDTTTASVCVYLYALVLQTIQIMFSIVLYAICYMSLSKIQSFPQICMALSKPVAYFEFLTCLNAMQMCCLIHIFIRFPRKANQ
jgi:hypothetical protein